MSGAAKYSQPLPAALRESPPIVYAGFVGDGIGFIVRQRGKKEICEAMTRENQANEKPKGFFASFARLMFGGKP
jgi:hypothetical protein